MKRERAAHTSSAEDFDSIWLSDEDDEEEREHTKATLRSASPPYGVSIEEWKLYKTTVRRVGFKRARPPRPELPIGRSVSVAPLTKNVAMHVDHPNTRILNVQQPWASLIAWGVKNIENRSSEFAHAGGTDEEETTWVAILASSHSFTKKEWQRRMLDVQRRIHWNDGYHSTGSRMPSRMLPRIVHGAMRRRVRTLSTGFGFYPRSTRS